MAKPKTAFTAAAAELAAEARNRQFSSAVTADDARKYVDTDVFVAWLVDEALGRDYEIILADTLAQRLTSAQAQSVLCAAVIDHGAQVLEIVKGAVVEQVARDLADAANLLVENFDPTDSEMSRSSYASQVDDPVRDDRRALARYAR